MGVCAERYCYILLCEKDRENDMSCNLCTQLNHQVITIITMLHIYIMDG
jgi:hypothetical protein